MDIQLTEGCIKDIVECREVKRPIVQILTIEYKTRIRDGKDIGLTIAVVSDGVYLSNPGAWLGTSAEELVIAKELTPNSIVRLDDFTCTKINTPVGKSALFLINCVTILKKGDTLSRMIGDPIPAMKFQTSVYKKPGKLNTLPIRALNHDNKQWYIKARVTSNENTSESSNKSFKVELTDPSGTITAIAYDEAVDRFYKLLKINRTCIIGRYDLSTEIDSKKPQIILKNDSVVIPVVQNVKFDFLAFSEVGKLEANSTVDIIGICIQLSDLKSSDNESCQAQYREMRLTNIKEETFTVILKNTPALRLNFGTTPVLALKEVTVKDDTGFKYVEVVKCSQVFIEPNIKEARDLKRWQTDNNREIRRQLKIPSKISSLELK